MAENHEDRMTNVKSATEEIRPSMANVESTTEGMRADMATMIGQLNNLIGAEYERKAARRATGLIDRYLNISSGEVLLARTQYDNRALREILPGLYAFFGATNEDD